MPKTVIVIPTYNEAENISDMVIALLSLPIQDLNILIVDDNSPDGTGLLANALAERSPDRVTVLYRSQKVGLGPAYVAGFKHALQSGADYIIQMDADFSHQPRYIPQLISAGEHYDLVVASRHVEGGSIDKSWSFYRKLLSWFANRVYTPSVLNFPIYDSTSGFRLWRSSTLLGVDLDRIHSSGYVFQIEMAYVTHKLGYEIVEIPIYFPDRKRGKSKMDFRIQFEAAIRVWQVKYRYNGLTPQNRRTQSYS